MKRLKYIYLSLLALTALVSCDNETLPADGGQEQAIALAVTLNKGQMSRAAIGTDDLDGENYIINGEYSIFLGLDDKELGFPKVHCCRFPDSKNGLIYPVTFSNGTATVSAAPLKWSDEKMKDIKEFEFIFDNMGYSKEVNWDEDSNFLGNDFTDEEKTKTYAAQKEEYEDGKAVHTNDIIWGRAKAVYKDKGKKPSVVELTHRMTRINVACVDLETVLETNFEEQCKSMTISIENLVLQPESFNRADGTVAIAETPTRAILTLKHKGEDLRKNEDGGIEDEDGTKFVEWDTPNFILPPQPLVVGTWPKVVVTYTDNNDTERTVEGLIPSEILNESNSWEALNELQAGNHLTIVVRIKEGIPDIIFTAKVRKWVELGPVVVTATQRKPGITSMRELEACIRMYNSLPVFSSLDDLNALPLWSEDGNDRYHAVDDIMLLYGKPESVNGAMQWTFPINFKLNKEKLPKTLFRNFSWATAGTEYKGYSYPLVLTSGTDSEGKVLNTQEELDKLKGDKGIYNIEDLNAMVSTVINDAITYSPLYGTLDVDWSLKTATYTFDLRNDITGEIKRKLPKTINTYPMTYIINTNGFSVNSVTDVEQLKVNLIEQ